MAGKKLDPALARPQQRLDPSRRRAALAGR
jgi:hypothetical protein